MKFIKDVWDDYSVGPLLVMMLIAISAFVGAVAIQNYAIIKKGPVVYQAWKKAHPESELPYSEWFILYRDNQLNRF